MGRKRSKVWEIEKDELQDLLDESDSIADVLKALGLKPFNGNHRTLNKRIEKDALSLDQLSRNRTAKRKSRVKKREIPLEDILVANSSYTWNRILKKRLLENSLLEYKCSECNIVDTWNGKPISLQLDHINGTNNDNRLENLRLLCPNCHSQTETFCGKHKAKINKCLDCDKKISGLSKRCKRCASKIVGKNQRRFEVTKEELQRLVEIMPMTRIGEKFGVSDNAVRKRCKLLGVQLGKR